jgi:hypothetical protein
MGKDIVVQGNREGAGWERGSAYSHHGWALQRRADPCALTPLEQGGAGQPWERVPATHRMENRELGHGVQLTHAAGNGGGLRGVGLPALVVKWWLDTTWGRSSAASRSWWPWESGVRPRGRAGARGQPGRCLWRRKPRRWLCGEERGPHGQQRESLVAVAAVREETWESVCV